METIRSGSPSPSPWKGSLLDKSRKAATGYTTAQDEFPPPTAVSGEAQARPNKKICAYSCKYCFDLAKEPVLNVICGHIFCWRCIYVWCSSSTILGQKGGCRQGCPFCKSHLDISLYMSTVIPLCSGPEPGVEFAIDDEPDSDEEAAAEEKRKEACRKERKEYVIPRPAWKGRSIHLSKIQAILELLFHVKAERSRAKNRLDRLALFAPTDLFLPYEEECMYKMIELLKDGWLWLTGGKFDEGQIELQTRGNLEKVGDHKFTPLPTDEDFPGVSTFLCKICKKIAYEPVVSECAHLFCWICLWNDRNSVSSCPVCDSGINIYASRTSINSIYCNTTESSKEDEYLKSNRNEETQAPCRFDQTIVAPYLQYMISRIDGDAKVMMEELGDLQSKYACLSKEQIKEAISVRKAKWDNLYEHLVNKWRVDAKEQVKEHLIRPTLLDMQFGTKKKSEDGNISVYELTYHLVGTHGESLDDSTPPNED